MNSRNNYGMGYNQYHNINTQQYSNAMIKNGTSLGINNNVIPMRYGGDSFNRNFGYSYSSVNKIDDAKMKKFNSYSAKARYKTNANNGFPGYYVMPIPNIPKRIITVKVPQNDIIEIKKDDYNVEEIYFKTSPKKYNYKPYKKPNRKNNLKSKPCCQKKEVKFRARPQCHEKDNNCKCYCNCPGCIKNGKNKKY